MSNSTTFKITVTTEKVHTIIFDNAVSAEEAKEQFLSGQSKAIVYTNYITDPVVTKVEPV